MEAPHRQTRKRGCNKPLLEWNPNVHWLAGGSKMCIKLIDQSTLSAFITVHHANFFRPPRYSCREPKQILLITMG
jgi:hypothetical protein